MIEFIIVLLFMNCVSFYMGTLIGRKFGTYVLYKVAEELLKAGMTQDQVIELFDKVTINIKKKDTEQ